MGNQLLIGQVFVQKKWLLRGALALLIATLFSLKSEANRSRTWGVPEYLADPSAKFDLVIEEDFENPRSYTDPDFGLAIDLPSPLEDSRFDSYNVIVIVNQEDTEEELGQTMRVYDREVGLRYFWTVSTARKGKVTPDGYFRIENFSSRHRSSLYNNAPMPWAVFFNGNIATHGVEGNNIDALGKRASAGCVRMEPSRAQALFHLIGHSESGYVDVIGPTGQPRIDGRGERRTTWAYRTLIVIKSSERY